MLRALAFSRRLLPGVLVSALLIFQLGAQRPALRRQLKYDWPQFGFDVASSGSADIPTGITAANVATLSRRQVRLNGTVDASAIYLHDVGIAGGVHDAFFVTTTYGKTIAVDADSGAVLWEYTPAGFNSWVGSAQVTNSTPVADPGRESIYATAPDGAVRKLSIADGRELWATPITLLPGREKMASPLKLFRGRVIAVTGGYIGDANPYQGHVAVLDAQNGALLSVWNSLCSNRTGLIQPSSCSSSRSAIWGRSGAVIDPATGNIFVATGNGPYNGTTDWGDALLELDPGATRIVGNYTPANNATLNARDLDLGSVSPILLGPNLVAQGGKDSLIHVLDRTRIAGATAHSGNETQSVPTPSANEMFTSAAVWRDRGETWMFAADGAGTAAWTVSGQTLSPAWNNSMPGTSPVVAGRLLFVYSPNGGLRVYDPRTGRDIATLASGGGHWNSPIVVDGRIALPEGAYSARSTTGVLNIWSVAAQ
jgi:outer membrane protein assembly factor BamB